MRYNLFGSAALAATVSLGVLTGGLTGTVVFDGVLGHAARAAEQGQSGGGLGRGTGFGGSGSGLGAGTAGAGTSGQTGSGGAAADGTVVPGAGAPSADDRAVDRTLGIGAGPGGTVSGSGETEGGAAGTALGKPADQQGEGTAKVGKTDPKAEDGAAEAQAMAAAAATAPVDPSADSPEGNAPPKAPVPEIGGNGFFSQKIAIDVPAFRGLEPKISLNYSSARKTRLGGLYQGWLGYAWGLDGFDVIERATPGYGYPTFDANDVYLLNGEELVKCTTGMVAASCSAGGTHVTENENFKRVIFNTSANTWTVTDRDGTVSLFKSVQAIAGTNPAAGTPDYDLQRNGRFLLSSVTDTNGNVVNYSYTCPDLPVCYPSIVRYANYGGQPGISVNFVYEARPDYIVMANGLGLSYTKKRIKTIAVMVGTTVRNAYALTYDQAPFSNASRLLKVDRHAKGATIAADGTITSTAVKLIRQMTYDNLAFNYKYVESALATSNSVLAPNLQAADLNFDGQDELFGIRDLGETCPDCTLPVARHDFSLELSRFSNDGSTTNKTSVKMPYQYYGIIPDTFTWTSGGYVAGKTKDIALTYIYRDWVNEDNSPVYAPKEVSNVVVTNSSLGISVQNCSGAYAAVCSSTPRQSAETPSITRYRSGSLDHNADGIDNVIGFGQTIAGVADFSANGRQGVVGHDTAYRFVNGAWTGSGTGVNCQRTVQTGLTFCVLGDINGDGATDIVGYYRNTSSGDFQTKILLSTGKGFVQVADGWKFRVEATLRDVDNDGRIDINNDGSFYAFASTSTGLQVLPSNYALPSGYSALGDFNGDGLPDLRRLKDLLISQSGTGSPNLLRTVKLETGGTISVDYTPSTRWTNTFMPQVLHAVTQLRLNDGRGQIAATDYAYSGGLYDPKARKFLGYKTITVTKPLANGETARPVTEITYRQDLASYGLPERTISRNAANTASKNVAETYAVNATAKPYRALNTATETTFVDGSAATLRKERDFDTYGNIIQIRDFGRTDIAGDETRTEFNYAPNTSNYLVSAPYVQRTVNLTSNTYLSWDAYYYDGLGSLDSPPTRGNVTVHHQVTSVGSAANATGIVAHHHSYDEFGNRTASTNGASDRTEWDYDATYHLHVAKERAPKYFATGGNTADSRFVTTYSPDYVCGQPASKVDWNGVTETYTYDAFCRPFGYTNAGTGSYLNTRYENEGDPASQAVVTYHPSTSWGPDVFTRTYYDGLGRPWRVQRPGEWAGNPTRLADTIYDARGNIAQSTHPYFDNEVAYWTVNSYDWQDRIARSVNPDGSIKSYQYFARRTADYNIGGSTNPTVFDAWFTDELGQQIGTIMDANRREVGRFFHRNGNYTAHMYATYDALGRLLNVQDNEGARWSYTYDLIGNRLSANDPDLGYWMYMYDGANRLSVQRDARGVQTNLTYDQLGRLLTKQVWAPGEPSSVTVTNNTYDEVMSPQSHNVGLMTRAVNDQAKLAFDRRLTGWGSFELKETLVDGLMNWSNNMTGRTGITTGRDYGTPQVSVGMADPWWRYNAADLLYSVPDYINSMTYEADGQTRTISYANGVTTEFFYSPQRRWLTRVTTRRGVTVLMDNQYTRNAIGQITAISGLTPSDSWIYTYSTDGFHRLVSADNLGLNALDETYSYSLNGNLTHRTRMGTYIYPAQTAARPHAATQIGARSLTYDANGNLNSDGVRTLGWDRSNQLQIVHLGNTSTSFAYGPDGSRAKKSSAFGTTLYAGADIEIDRPTPGAEVYTRYPHPDIKIVTTATGVTSRYFLHRDHLSSVRLVTDAAGNVVEQNNFAAYGEPTNPAMQTKKGYIGERLDVETGLMYLNARYYDPSFGRFISKDDGAESEGEVGIGSILLRPPAAAAKPAPHAATSTATPALQ